MMAIKAVGNKFKSFVCFNRANTCEEVIRVWNSLLALFLFFVNDIVKFLLRICQDYGFNYLQAE